MREMELKIKLDQITPAALAKRLAEIGFLQGPVVKEEDVYFREKQEGNLHLQRQVLRLRTSRDILAGTTRNYLTYKGAREDKEAYKNREEIETGIENAATTKVLWDRLGFVPAHTVKKTRRYYHCGEITACLDVVEGLGPFLELEIMVDEDSKQEAAGAHLLDLMEKTGLKRDSLMDQSYLELLLAKGE